MRYVVVETLGLLLAVTIAGAEATAHWSMTMLVTRPRCRPRPSRACIDQVPARSASRPP
ncbi:hypothetical protein [Streptomyces tanashiensis]